MKAVNLIIRADGDSQMGLGHVMRCLALGQACRDAGGEVVFVTTCSSQSVLQRLRQEGFTVRTLNGAYPGQDDWTVTRSLLEENPDSWLVLDGYHFNSDYQQQVKAAGYHLLLIDGLARLPHYYADIVLNQNLYAEQLQYQCEPYTRLLCGTRYFLLRREFVQCQGGERTVPEQARKVLVTLGGGDSDNITIKVLTALNQVSVNGLEVVAVVGASNPHYEELQDAGRHLSFAYRLERNPTHMPDLMAWADVAVTAGGTTVWELAFMQVPGVLLVTAENQLKAAESLNKIGLFPCLGWGRDLDVHAIVTELEDLMRNTARRRRMIETGMRFVDGQGSVRVMAQMDGLERGNGYSAV